MHKDKLGKFILGVSWDDGNTTWSVYIAKTDGKIIAEADDYDLLSDALDQVSEAIALAL